MSATQITLTNNSQATDYAVSLLNLGSDGSLQNTQYRFSASYIADYNGYQFYLTVNGTNTALTLISTATTPTQMAALLTALGYGTFSVDSDSSGNNVFWVNSSTNVFTALSIANATWVAQTSGTLDQLYSVYFINANIGWSVGLNGTILKTINGGTTWVTQVSGTADELYSIFFINVNIGWTSGRNGTILKTIDAGTTWIAQTSGVALALQSVYFTDANIGWIVGDGGTILKTINGGTTWVAQTSGIANLLLSVYFTDLNTGYVVGASGTILKTINGGTTWVAQISGTSDQLYSVYFIDANTGYTVGGSGTILKTINGGTTWVAQISGTSDQLYSVYFIDLNTGYAVGSDSGIILKTINGGTTWVAQASSDINDLLSVFFINANTGYAVGDVGTIIKLTNASTSTSATSINTVGTTQVQVLSPVAYSTLLESLIGSSYCINSITLYSTNATQVQTPFTYTIRDENGGLKTETIFPQLNIFQSVYQIVIPFGGCLVLNSKTNLEFTMLAGAEMLITLNLSGGKNGCILLEDHVLNEFLQDIQKLICQETEQDGEEIIQERIAG